MNLHSTYRQNAQAAHRPWCVDMSLRAGSPGYCAGTKGIDADGLSPFCAFEGLTRQRSR